MFGNMFGKYVAISGFYHNYAIMMTDNGSVFVNTNLPSAQVQPGNYWERFLVVSYGDEEVAFYSPCHKRFLRMEDDGTVNGFGGVIPNEDQLPTNWLSERFQLIPEEEGTRYLIYNTHAKRFLRVHNEGTGVDGGGGVIDSPHMIPPFDVWGSERLILTNHPF